MDLIIFVRNFILVFAILLCYCDDVFGLRCWGANEDDGKYCRLYNTESRDVKVEVTCEVKTCGKGEKCLRKQVRQVGKKGSGGFNVYNVDLQGCGATSQANGCKWVELTEETMCVCDHDLCNAAVHQRHQPAIVIPLCFASLLLLCL